MTTLACIVIQKSLSQNVFIYIQSMKRNKIGKIQGRLSRRRLVCNPMIHHVIINWYTKYHFSSLQKCCREIFNEKVLRNYGRTDRCKPVYPALFQSRDIKSFSGRDMVVCDIPVLIVVMKLDMSLQNHIFPRNKNITSAKIYRKDMTVEENALNHKEDILSFRKQNQQDILR